MADIGFKTKYRSRTFDEYIGNTALKTTIMNRFATDEPYPTSLMVFGQSGCGKTTIGRLIVKQVLCSNKIEKSIGNRVYKVPCNECSYCKECDDYIQTGIDENILNVEELDATKTRKVEDVDAFIERVKVPSMYGGTSVYLIDECHMLTQSSQNTLLKVLEDPPLDTLFIFCTTDPHKVIDTIRNRMDLTVEVLKPTLENNIELLTNVCSQEGIAFDTSGLALIAERSNYTYRSSLANLENVYRSQGAVRYADVEASFDMLPTKEYFDFFKFLNTKNIVMYVSLLSKVEHGIGCKKFVQGMRDFVKRGLYIANGIGSEGVIRSDLPKFKALFKEFSMDEVINLLDFLNKAEDGGDLETRLLLLGYRGLDYKPTVASDDTTSSDSLALGLEVSTTDSLKEKHVLEGYQAECRQEAYRRSNDNANLGLIGISPDKLFNSF